MRYTAYGHLLASQLDLPVLPPANETSAAMSPHITIRVNEGPAPSAVWDADDQAEPRRRGHGPVDELGDPNDGEEAPADPDEPWLRVGRSAGGFVLQFGQRMSFWVSSDASRIVVHGAGRMSDAVQHLLVDQVVPLALAHRGALVLHGGGVLIHGHAVALFGPSGTGKSTLTASLAQDGSGVLADDALVIAPGGGAAGFATLAHPAYPGLRVWPDVLPASDDAEGMPFVADYTEKRRVALAAGRFVTGPRRLQRLYLLEPDEAASPRIARLSKRAAVMAILTHSYVLDASDASRLSAQLATACAVLDAADVRTLSFPRDLARLAEVREALRTDLAT